MTCVMIVVGFANGSPCPIKGQYLCSYDVNAHDGHGHSEWSDDLAEALKFPSAAEAMTAWRTQSTVRPTRSDGKPNRPLTAITVEVISTDELPNAPSTERLQ